MSDHPLPGMAYQMPQKVTRQAKGKANTQQPAGTPIFSCQPYGRGRSFAMSTCHARLHIRGNDLGDLEMAASLDFLHFHQIGWKSFSAAS